MGNHGAGQLTAIFRWSRRTGAYRFELDDGFRQILRELIQQFLDLLADPGAPVLHRLFPPAYSDQADLVRQDEYRRLMQDDLAERRRADCHVVLETLSERRLSEEQLLAFSRSVNGLRLALGTYLDIHDDSEPLGTTEGSAYQFLTWMLQESIDALAGRSA